MTSAPIKSAPESSTFKWAQLIASVVIVPLLLRNLDQLEEIKKAQAQQSLRQAVTDEQLGSVKEELSAIKSMGPIRNAQFANVDAALAAINNKQVVTDFRLNDLEAWRKLTSRR